MANILEQIKKD